MNNICPFCLAPILFLPPDKNYGSYVLIKCPTCPTCPEVLVTVNQAPFHRVALVYQTDPELHPYNLSIITNQFNINLNSNQPFTKIFIPKKISKKYNDELPIYWKYLCRLPRISIPSNPDELNQKVKLLITFS